METKIKDCKAIGKAHGFDSCGKPTMKRTFGLCPSCLYDFYTTDERGKIIYAKSFLPKVSKRTEQRKKENTKALKEKIINWRDKLQNKLQEIARLLDKGQPCPARGFTNYQAHGGHVFARGGNSTIALNLHNIHRQSAQSNHWQNDDLLFREGLANEYGQDYIEFISNLRRTPQLKYKNEDYHVFYKIASQIALKLKKDYFAYPKSVRIDLRNEFNIKIGIYDREYCLFESGAVKP